MPYAIQSPPPPLSLSLPPPMLDSVIVNAIKCKFIPKLPLQKLQITDHKILTFRVFLYSSRILKAIS